MVSAGGSRERKIDISQNQLGDFCDLIYDEAGLLLDKPKFRNRLEWKIKKRMVKKEIEDPQEYYEYLWFSENSNEELRQLINSCVVNETLFFRYKNQLDYLRENILPTLLRCRHGAKNNPVKIFSCGCSNGAEPYSLAICYIELCERQGFDMEEPGLEIIGVDISTKALSQARGGRYSARTVENAPARVVEKYFEEVEAGYKIVDRVKDLVTFKFLNLVDSTLPRELDMLYCRNVLIYFDSYVREKVFQKFHRALKDDGLLFLGPSEAITPFGEYFKEYDDNNLQVYQKWSTDRREASLWDQQAEEKSSPSVEKRKPAYQKSPPEFSSLVADDAKIQCVEISGVIDKNIPYAQFRGQFRKNIIPGKDRYYLDLREVKYISNAHLRQVVKVLAGLDKVKAGEAEVVFVTEEDEVKKWLCDHSSAVEFRYRSALPDFSFGGSTTGETESLTRRESDGSGDGSGDSRIDELLEESQDPDTPSEKIVVQEKYRRMVIKLGGELDCERDPSLSRRLKEEISENLNLLEDTDRNYSSLEIKFDDVKFIDKKIGEIVNRSQSVVEDEPYAIQTTCSSTDIRRKLIRWNVIDT